MCDETPLGIIKGDNVTIKRKTFPKKLPKTRKNSRSFISWHSVRQICRRNTKPGPKPSTDSLEETSTMTDKLSILLFVGTRNFMITHGSRMQLMSGSSTTHTLISSSLEARAAWITSLNDGPTTTTYNWLCSPKLGRLHAQTAPLTAGGLKRNQASSTGCWFLQPTCWHSQDLIPFGQRKWKRQHTPVRFQLSASQSLNERTDAVPWLVDGIVIGVGASMSTQINERIDAADSKQG